MTQAIQEDIHRATAAAFESGPAFRRLCAEERAAGLGAALQSLLPGDSERGAQARARCAESSMLHPTMIDWALRTSIPPTETLKSLARTLPESGASEALSAPPSLGVVVLAGNVFTACIRALAFPLLAGVPTIIKASSRDGALPLLLKDAWAEAMPQHDGALEVITFSGADETLMSKLLAQSELVIAYGSDHSLRSLREQTPISATFVGHGHGLGAAYLPAESLHDEAEAIGLTRLLARDIAAYDQRGCLSPHAVIVQNGGAITPAEFALLLARHGLSELGREMPRGALPRDIAAQQLQWRGVAAAQGALHEGDGFATSFERGSALRLSPGWRNVQVLSCDDVPALHQILSPLGRHLKALSVRASIQDRRRLAQSLPASLCPRVTAVGEMQTPAFSATADGLSPWLGVQRWIDLG